MHDLALDALHASLRGLTARQRVIADNIANVETPTFLAGRVDFEDSLRRAVAGGSPMATDVSTRRSTAATTPNGNNVELDDETLAMIETEMRYELSTQAMTSKYQLLRTAMRSQGQ